MKRGDYVMLETEGKTRLVMVHSKSGEYPGEVNVKDPITRKMCGSFYAGHSGCLRFATKMEIFEGLNPKVV